MYYRRSAGVLVGGPYNVTQNFPVELLDDASAEVVAYLASTLVPLDLSNIDNNPMKIEKALALCIAQVGGLTVPQMKTLFAQKYNSLP
jgi:hypothetical protein